MIQSKCHPRDLDYHIEEFIGSIEVSISPLMTLSVYILMLMSITCLPRSGNVGENV